MILLIVQTLNFCYLEYFCDPERLQWDRGLRLVTQVLTPLELQREALEGPVVLPGEPPCRRPTCSHPHGGAFTWREAAALCVAGGDDVLSELTT